MDVVANRRVCSLEKASATALTSDSGSPAKPTAEAAEPSEDAFVGAMDDGQKSHIFPKIKLRSSVRCITKQSCLNENITEKNKTTDRERMRLYRQRIRSCPELHRSYKNLANERNRAYRANLSEVQKLNNREKTRLRVKKWREKKKLDKQAQGNDENSVELQRSKPKTRIQCQKLREVWRNSKQKQRRNMSSQKKRRVNEKRRQKYAEKKSKKVTAVTSLKKHSVEHAEESQKSLTKSNEARRKAAYRAMSEVNQAIPASPGTFAKFMTSLARTTPRKRKALESEGFYVPNSKRKLCLDTTDESIQPIQKELHENRMKRSREHLRRRRLLAKVVHLSNCKSSNTGYKQMKDCGVSWKFFSKASRLEGVWESKKRNDGLDDDTVDKIEHFFKSSGVSACMPDKKLVSLKSMEPRRIMDTTLQMSYEQFKNQNPDCPVGFSKFAALRPKCVKTMKNNSFNNCLCEYCSNIEIKATILNKLLKGKFNKYELTKRTLCPKEEGEIFFKKECINRNCSQCGVDELKTELSEALNRKTVSWKRWENQIYKDKSGKQSSRKMLRLKDHNVGIFLDELCEELNNFSSHLHNARWQHQQFTSLTHDIPKNWVLFCMDYAENYTCLYQDEAQSAHWSHDQATLFSIVAYYRCNDCREIVNESLVFVSDDKKHDCHAVHHFVTVANDHLTKSRNVTIENEIHFSDGAASQFKSKTPFADVANSTNDFGFPCEKHFFGSRHGKGPCDGEFGVVKRTVSQCVVARKTLVRNAKEFYNCAKEKLTKPKNTEDLGCSNHKRRTFFYVSETDVSRNRIDRINAKPIPETRKLHGVKPCTECATGVATRLLSCFCAYCTGSGTESSCKSASHVGDWDGMSKPKSSVKVRKPSRSTKTKSKLKNGDSVKTNGPKAKQDTSLKKTDMEVSSPDKAETIKSQTRSEYFREALKGLQHSDTFEELQTKCTSLMNDKRFNDFQVEIDDKINIIDHILIADKVALNILPKVKLREEFKNRLPVTIIGDGNCFPRSVSVVCFGHENFHEEIRARIVVEMCTNIKTYTDNKYLNKGVELPQKEAASLVQSYSMFSDEYTPGQRLTKTAIQSIYEAEALKVVEDNAFMGIWQLFCAASVVGVTLVSIYPNLGDRLPKLLLNRNILPRKHRTYQSEMLILWTSTREDLEERNWIPNHFVPILPQCADSELVLDFEEEGSSEDSVNDNLIQQILQQLYDECPVVTDLTASAKTSPATSTEAPCDETDPNPSVETGLTCSDRKELNESPVVTDLTASAKTSPATSAEAPCDETDPNPSVETGLTCSDRKELNESPVVTDLTASVKTSPATSAEAPCDETDANPSVETGLTCSDRKELNESPVVTDLTASAKTSLAASAMTGLVVGAEVVDNKTDLTLSDETGITLIEETGLKFKYQSGCFIVVSHGTSLLPAVVDKWPWIRFCKKSKKQLWTINEIQHTIVEEDVVKTIDPPDIVICGTRLLYKFAEASRSSTGSPVTVTATVASSDVTANTNTEVVLTEDIVKEEQQWEQEGQKEEEEELNKRQQLWALMSEDSKEERYARLQFLLSKSNMYTEYLLKRMESQKEAEKQKRLRQIKRKENKDKKEQDKNKDTVTEESKTNSEEGLQNENKTVLSAKAEAMAKDSNIPKSPAVGDTAHSVQSPRRKLPAPKPKSALAGKAGSSVPGKENNNPDPTQSRPSENSGNSTQTSVLEGPQALRRGRKRKAAEESKSLIVNFFQPTSKRKKAADEEEKTKVSEKRKKIKESSTEENEDKEDGKGEQKKSGINQQDNSEDDDPMPDIEEDGTVVKPALLSGGDLRRYQIEGLNWLKVLYENGVNGILADEMGLGKTIQCIALIAHLGFNSIPGPFLVVAPLSTLPNWRAEFKKFAPKVPVLFYHGYQDERAKLRKKIKKLNPIAKDKYMRPVVITSYEITMRDRKYLQDYDWRLMIVDEGHRIKNTQCRLIKELRHYKNTHRLLLTGTPLQNNLSELWSLLNFLLPEIFDDLGSFESWFDVAVIAEEGADEAIVEAEQRKNVLSMLHQILTPFMLRRIKSDVDLMIPPKKELIVYAPMTKEQQELYESTVDRTILKKIEEKNTVKEEVELSEAGRPRRRAAKKKINYRAMMESEKDSRVPKDKRKDEEELESWVNEMWTYNNTCVTKEEKLKVSQVTIRLQNIMMQLRKCCNHPYLLEYPLDALTGEFKIDENVISKCGKMIILDRMLTDLKKRGHKVLIFSQMTKMLDILEDYCIIRKLKYCRLDGSYSVEDRHAQMDSFNTDPSSFVFLLSTRAGGLGINLTAADTVIIYDSDWNPQCDLQAQDRCHRIGQTRPVVVYRFVTANTIDQKIVERAAAKRKLEKMIIHKGKFKTGIRNFSREIKPLRPEELMDLLKSRDYCQEVHQGQDVGISDQDLDQLLDRTDLYEEFERTAKEMIGKSGGKIKVGKETKTKKSTEMKKSSKLFKEIDYTAGGSTQDLKPEDEISEGLNEEDPVKSGSEMEVTEVS